MDIECGASRGVGISTPARESSARSNPVTLFHDKGGFRAPVEGFTKRFFWRIVPGDGMGLTMGEHHVDIRPFDRGSNVPRGCRIYRHREPGLERNFTTLGRKKPVQSKLRRKSWLEISECLDRSTGTSAHRFGGCCLWLCSASSTRRRSCTTADAQRSALLSEIRIFRR